MTDGLVVKEIVKNENGHDANKFLTKHTMPIVPTAIDVTATASSTTPLDWLQQCFISTKQTRNFPYGREKEVKYMKEVYNTIQASISSPMSPRSHVIFISGNTGIGKTNLARSVLQHHLEVIDDERHLTKSITVGCNNTSNRNCASAIRNNNEYYISGKYDQLQRPEPHSAVVAAFTDLIQQMKDRNTIHDLSHALQEHNIDYEHDGKDLICMIPALQSIIEKESEKQDATSISNTNSKTVQKDAHVQLRASSAKASLSSSFGLSTNRWKELFRLLLRVISSMKKMIVCLIEDLHWADESSIAVLQSLFEDKVHTGALFICTYRKDEDDEANGKLVLLDRLKRDLQQNDVKLTHFDLNSLPINSITAIISNCLSIDRATAEPLATLISDWTKGNVLLVWKYIHFFYLKELIYIDPLSKQFVWDINEIQMEGQAAKDLLQYKLDTLSIPAQEHLKMVACLGSKLDEDILFPLFSRDKEAVNYFIDEIAQIFFIRFDVSRGAWYFTHDFVQEKIYSQIPVNDRHVFHYRIGRKLWREFDIDELSHFLFLVVGQLLLGIKCIKDHREQVAVAKLCLEAGVRSFQGSNFHSSYNYLQKGISLMGEKSWDDEYDLMMNLYNAAAEVANCLGKFTDVNVLVSESLAHSRTFDDSHRSRATNIQALGRGSRLEEAVTSALDVLSHLGENFATKPSAIRILSELSYVRWRLRQRSNEMILRLPIMTDPKKLAAMEIMNLIPIYSALVIPKLTPLLLCRMVHISLDHGLSAVSCVGFVGLAAMVSGIGQAFFEADRLGKLGFELLKKFDAKAWLARISDIYYDLVSGWVRPFLCSRKPLLYAYNLGMQTGDTEFAIACAMNPLFLEFDMSPLSELECLANRLLERIDLYGLKMFRSMVEPMWHLMKFLMENYDGDISTLKKRIENDDHFYSDASFDLMMEWKKVHRAFNFYLFCCYDEAYECSPNFDKLVVSFYGPSRCSLVAMVGGLIDVAYARQMKRKNASKARKLSKLLLRWATQGEPRNFIGKHYLLEAELAALAGKHARSYQLYICAIGACREGKFLLYTAIATERVAKSLLHWGKNELAGPYFQEALSLYVEWGAIGKVQHLQEEMRQLGI